MKTTEPSDVSKASRPPVQAFSSPYIDQPIKQIHDWFVSYIYEPWLDGFTHYIFIVLDEYCEDTESCIVGSIMDGPVEYIRCDFHLALEIAMACEMGTSRLSDEALGMVQDSGEILTREMDDLGSTGGCCIEGGEVKRDEAWVVKIKA